MSTFDADPIKKQARAISNLRTYSRRGAVYSRATRRHRVRRIAGRGRPSLTGLLSIAICFDLKAWECRTPAHH